MGRKRDTVWWHGDVDRWRASIREETTLVGLTRILLSQKIKKIHAVDLADSNVQWRLKTTMSYFIFLKHMQVISSFIHLTA
jgi:hypothetical protein